LYLSAISEQRSCADVMIGEGENQQIAEM